MPKINITAARKKTRIFFQKSMQTGLVYRNAKFLYDPKDFPAFFLTDLPIKETKFLVEYFMYDYRHLLDCLSSHFYNIPFETCIRNQLKAKFPESFNNLLAEQNHRWKITAEQYLEFADALIQFADGKSAPTPRVMENGITIFQEWAAYYNQLAKEADNAGRRIDIEGDAEIATYTAGQIKLHISLHADLVEQCMGIAAELGVEKPWRDRLSEPQDKILPQRRL